MIIKIYVRNVGATQGWHETFEIPSEADPWKWASDLIKKFNETLRPNEEPRELIRLRQLKSRGSLPYQKLKHEWRKTNLVTIVKGVENYDTYVCDRCKATGKRFGLSDHVVLDKKSSKHCKA